MQELSQFMSLVSTESQKVQKIKEEKEKRLTPKIDVNKSLGDFFAMISEVKSVSSIVEAPKVSGDHDLFKSNTHLQISLPEPKEDLESELVKVKNTVSGRTEKDIQSVKDHDTHTWYAIEQYCKENNLEYNEGLCESIVDQSKPTIKYFKDMFAVKRPFEIDGTLDVLPSTTNNTRSYPSGHATQAMLVALHLSEKHPDHKDALIRAAKECGLGRIVAGFHYPMDYKTGNLLAEKMFVLMNRDMEEAARIPRKKGQPAGSDKHSDLYTDENPKGTIHGLGFKDVETARASINKIKNSGKTHAHKIQAAVAMEQRAKEMGKSAEAKIYRTYIDQMKKKTKEMQKEDSIIDELVKEFQLPSGKLTDYLKSITVDRKAVSIGMQIFKNKMKSVKDKYGLAADIARQVGVGYREFQDVLTRVGLLEYYEIGTDQSAHHTMSMTPGQPIQNFRRYTMKIDEKDIEKFANEGDTIDKYKKRYGESWKEELDKTLVKMRNQLQ